MSAPVVLSDRSRRLLAIITRAADAREETPVTDVLMAELGIANSGAITNEVRRLEAAGLIRVHQKTKRRTFEVVATGARTKPRSKNGKHNLAMRAARARRTLDIIEGWPRPTAASAAAYDAAMARRPFAISRVEPVSRPHPPIRGAESRSHIGCSLVAG